MGYVASLNLIYTYKEIFGNDSINKKFRLDFKSEDGREHCCHGFIHDIDQYMNHLNK